MDLPTFSADSRRLTVRLVTLLAGGFVLQLWAPLILGGSTGAGALAWVALSLLLFAIPALSLSGRIGNADVLIVATCVFLPPGIFIGVANFANGNFEGRDLADYFRAPYFFIAFLAGMKLARTPGAMNQLLARALPAIAALLVVYLAASFAARDLVDDLELLYGKIDNAVSGRLFMPFPNPYDLALFCILPLLYCFLERRALLAFLFAAVLVATQSRTGILLCGFALLICGSTSQFARRRIFRLVFPALALVLVAFMFFVDIDDIKSIYLISNTLGLFQGESTTLSRRFAQWSYLQDLPLLGWGTIRSSELVIENAIIYEVYRTGILGVYSLLCFYVFPAFLALRVLARDRERIRIVLAIFIIVTILGFNASVFIYQPKISLLYWAATGALFAYATAPRFALRIEPLSTPIDAARASTDAAAN
jgi:hypothetical protein